MWQAPAAALQAVGVLQPGIVIPSSLYVFVFVIVTVTPMKTRAQQYLRWATVATVDMGRKEAGAMPLLRWELGPCLTQCGLGRGLLPYQVASSSIQPFGHNRHGPKIGWGGCALFLG